MALELVPVGTAEIGLAEPLMMPGGPYGTRAVVEITSASYSGDRIQGNLKGVAAADWLVVSPQGIGLMDVRLTVETHDGAVLYGAYPGRVDISKGLEGAVVYSTPLFETGDERYTWVNSVQMVAKGVISAGILRYEIYELR